MSAQTQRMRALLAGDGLAVAVGSGDALTARLIERAGFDVIWSSSFCISAAYAVPDASLLSMTQYLEATRAMCDATALPVLADCDTGYGNANNVIYAVEQFERAGAAAVCFEDKRFPKDTSLLAGARQELATVEEFVGKIEAAAAARRDPDLVIVARTEALIAGQGQGEALRRGHAYVEAGADAILVHSKATTPDEIVAFIRAWDRPTPLVIIPTAYPSLTEAQIRALGKVKLVIYANQPLRAAVKAQEELLREIKRAGGIHTIEERMVPVTHVFELQGVPRLKENESRFVR
ncbi:MAG: isocitrate lyase/phosphoenolpyruvate mutase family protein [Chloroflexi bacterium]|nr:isocitrate lyase/phosphoenolpyruvate mutase family protein [Chloroflexota bacterium]